MSTPPPSSQRRQKKSPATTSPNAHKEVPAPQAPLAPKPNADFLHPASPTPNSRKRRASHSPKLDTLPPGTTLPSAEPTTQNVSIPALLSDDPGKKRSRTNTPWSAQEEQRLKQMRDAGHSWSEIAKAFPLRTEGSVKKHWYKDMHYAEFGEDESTALRDAIKEYEANKWKAIGQKLGKPAKACEQYAKEHFKERA